MEITNKFDNALTGVAGDNGETGTLVNAGNFYATGRFWDIEHLPGPTTRASTTTRRPASEPHNDDLILANVVQEYLPGGVAPGLSRGPALQHARA